MKIDEAVIFSTKLKKFYFNTDEMAPLLTEIFELKNKIKKQVTFIIKIIAITVIIITQIMKIQLKFMSMKSFQC